MSSVLGARWRSEFGQKLGFDGSANNGTIWAYRPDGKAIKHILSSGVYLPDADISDRLYTDNTNGGAYRLHLSGHNIERYDAVGKLLSVTNADGQTQVLTYSDGTNGVNGGYVLDANGNATATVLPAGRLIRVSDVSGRSLQLGYDANGRVVKLTDPANQNYRYTYDAIYNLVSVTYPDTTVRTYHYNESQYTGGANLPNVLTGITDENGVRYVNYSYDSTGRAIDEVFPAVGTNTNRYQLSFGTNSTTVTDPLGTARTYSFQTILGVVKSTGSSQPGGSGCGPASANLTYDANGNVASRSDFNGYRTNYSYDLTRNLETQRQEGLNGDGSVRSESRTISTSWHSYWRLPIKVAEPKKLTRWVYNGDVDPATGTALTCAPAGATVPSITGGTQPIGVLCKKSEQATTDETGSTGLNPTVTGTPRVWTYTYNAYGQVLTADGPRADVSDVTTYTYYAATDADIAKHGNLATITNALGHLTQITAYDANGRPLTIIDPNNVATTFTYWPRGWFKSRTTDGKTTSYDYTAWGRLERIAYPDGSFQHYDYDAAHRLTGISDAVGNEISLTLDAAGNILDTVWKNSDGTAAQSQQRRYDALGRVEGALAERDAVKYATIYGYDPMGHPTTVTTPKGKTSTTSNDAFGRATNMTDALSGQTRMQYDGQGQLTQLTSPNNAVTGFTVDGLGNVTQEASADRGTTNATYDAAGNLLTRIDARARVETRTWDALNRPLTVSYSHAGGAVTYTWDTGCSYGKGRLCRITDPGGSTAFAYDASGNRITEIRTEGSVTLPATQYAYNDTGRLTTQITPSGKVLTMTPDAAGRTTRIATALNGTETALADAIQTDAAGRVTALTLGHGGTQNWTYHADGSLSGGSDAPAKLPWFISYGPTFDYPALVAAEPRIAWQQIAWHAVADDADHDGDLDLFLYFNGTNENYRDITCVYDCGGWYAGPDFGNLVYLEKTTTGYVHRPFSNQDDIVKGDIEQMVPLDYNNDGKTDLLLVTNYYSTSTFNPAYFSSKPHRRLVLFKNDSGPAYAGASNPNGSHFSDVTVAVGLDKAIWYAEGLIFDLNQDGYPDILSIASGPNNTVLGDAFQYNPTSGAYQPITTSGLPRPLWLPALADLDSDGRLDIVAQDGTLGLRFFRNLGNGSFSEWTGTEDLTGLVGTDWAAILAADLDNDGRTDLATFETAYFGEYPNNSYAGGRLRWLRNAGVTAGQITFVEQPSAALEPSGNGEEVAYGGTVGDVNNDGWLDFMLATRANGSRLVIADGQGGFRRPEDTGEKDGLAAQDSRFAQPVLLDINGDGKADLLSTESLWTINGGFYLLTNTGSATASRSGLSVELTGRASGAGASGKDAFGARVEVTTASGRTQLRQVLPVMGLSRRLHFGLGEAPGEVTVRIYWPNDPTPQVLSGTSFVNSILRVSQP